MRSSTLTIRVIASACAICIFLLLAQASVLAAFTEQGATVLGGANYSARSASLADMDGDGDLDLLFQGATGAQQLFRNNFIGTGTLTYTNVTSTMFPSSGIGDSWSACWGDYNGDGRVDVFIGQTNSGTSGDVLRNDGASGFSIQSSATGLNDPGFHQNVGWVDINNDRRLDLLIGMEGPEPNEIYLQNANGTFSKAGAAAGFQTSPNSKAYGMAIGDYDGDGDLDVYISTCRGDNNIANHFYKNMLKETGAFTFQDVADTTTNGTQITKNTYGTEFVDFDNDGKLDLYVTGADGEKTYIFRNDGNGHFTDVDTITGHVLLHDANGVSTPGTDLNGSKAIDFDNDGKLDLFFHDNLSGTGNVKLYRNDGNWNFTDVTAQQGLTLDTVAGTPDPGSGGYDSVWGDLDRDGDQDLINPNNLTHGTGNNTPERVYVNNASTNGNHWLYVKLLGPSWDTTAIGASVYATMIDGSLQGVTLRREANANADTFNQSDVPVHFGLGTSSFVEWLRIVWPDGVVQFLQNVAVDQYLTVSEATAMPGDFNGDHTVDTNDFLLWRKYYGAPFTLDDYNTWRAHFGQTYGGGTLEPTSTVPEPFSMSLALAAVVAITARPRRRIVGRTILSISSN
jgi:hypothetical protein